MKDTYLSTDSLIELYNLAVTSYRTLDKIPTWPAYLNSFEQKEENSSSIRSEY